MLYQQDAQQTRNPQRCEVSDRGSERRRAAALARHYRDQENLTIAEIARRLGRAEATVKAYLYDPSDANKRPTESPQSGRLLVMHGRRSASGLDLPGFDGESLVVE